MRRDQLEHAIRTACQTIEHPEIIVVGSQAILGTFREEDLPPQATMSVQIDVLPIAALLDASLVDAADIVKLLADVPEPHCANAERARTWLSPWLSG
jgi:hypothetical protein